MQDICTNALNNAWPEEGTQEAAALATKAKEEEHVGSGSCGTGVGHCHSEAAALVLQQLGEADLKVLLISCGSCVGYTSKLAIPPCYLVYVPPNPLR